MQMHTENIPRNYFIYLGNKEIYCILKTCCTICFIFHKILFIS